jgi:hypothetical protein
MLLIVYIGAVDQVHQLKMMKKHKNTKRQKDEHAKPNLARRSQRQVPEASLEVHCNPGWKSIARSGLQCPGVTQ